MLNFGKLAASIPDNQLYVGMAISESMTNAYLVAKGVRDIAESHLWGINHPNLIEAITEYCNFLSDDDCCRPISVVQNKFSLVIYASEFKLKADEFMSLTSNKPSLSDMDDSIKYTRRVGILLGYQEKLVENFIDRLKHRASKRS